MGGTHPVLEASGNRTVYRPRNTRRCGCPLSLAVVALEPRTFPYDRGCLASRCRSKPGQNQPRQVTHPWPATGYLLVSHHDAQRPWHVLTPTHRNLPIVETSPPPPRLAAVLAVTECVTTPLR